jgi:hypothetical protein
VIGIVEGQLEGAYKEDWISSCIEKTYSPTVYRRKTTLSPSTDKLNGRHLITESGILVVHAKGSVLQLRDFTEVGAKRIHETYPFIKSII